MISYAGNNEDLKAMVITINHLEDYINGILSSSFKPTLKFHYRDYKFIAIRIGDSPYNKVTFEYVNHTLTISVPAVGEEPRAKDYESLAHLLKSYIISYFKLRGEYRNMWKTLGDEKVSND